ncbi:MAG TPA: CorA family divalent cation transporter [Puia sp.]|jgi:magnesium transporter
MIKTIIEGKEGGFAWLDVAEPTMEELDALTRQFNLHPGLLNDCTETDQLPKYEKIDDYVLMVFRISIDNDTPEADSMHELTDTIYFVYSASFLISICYKRHILREPLFLRVTQANVASSYDLLNLMISTCLLTYLQPLDQLTKATDYFEKDIFLTPNKVPVLKGLYYLKRKADLFKRIILLSSDVVDFIYGERENMDTRDTKDQHMKLHNSFDALADNIHQLLNIYFSVSSQRTNETMRVLTIFSVFFLPLSFVVGLYGMNFNIPETKWKYGYPLVILFMFLLTFFIYKWFKRKRWL